METDTVTDEFQILDRTGFLAIPKAIIGYNSKALYNTYTVLENQLSQLNQCETPLVYNELNKLTQTVFDSWVKLGCREEGFGCVPSC